MPAEKKQRVSGGVAGGCEVDTCNIVARLAEVFREYLEGDVFELYSQRIERHITMSVSMLVSESFDSRSLSYFRKVGKLFFSLRLPDMLLVSIYRELKKSLQKCENPEILLRLDRCFRAMSSPYIMGGFILLREGLKEHRQREELIKKLGRLKELCLQHTRAVLESLIREHTITQLDEELEHLVGFIGEQFEDSKLYRRLEWLCGLYRQNLNLLKSRDFDFEGVYTCTKEVDRISKSIGQVVDELLLSLMSDMVYVDTLTGLYNRNYLSKALERETNLHKRHHLPLSLVMIDVDDFKKINDRYGHQVGDCVLSFIGNSIKGILSSYDIPVRYGGEEFLLVLPYTSEEGAYMVARKIRNFFNENQFMCGPLSMHVTVSLGVAQVKDYDNPQKEIEKADRALYVAKRLGKNMVAVAKDAE